MLGVVCLWDLGYDCNRTLFFIFILLQSLWLKMLSEGVIADVGVRAGQINLWYFLISHRLQTKNEKNK